MGKPRKRAGNGPHGGRGASANGHHPSKKPKRPPTHADDFFQHQDEDEEELSSSEDEAKRAVPEEFENEVQEEDAETADEKRLRVAKAYLEKIRALTSQGDEDVPDRDAVDRKGERDSLVADLLQQEQLEESGRVQRSIAARVVEPSIPSEGRNVGRRHRQTVTAIALTEDDSRGFAASKDGLIVHWDIESGLSETYEWPTQEPSTSSATGISKSQNSKGRKGHGSKHVLALAVSSDGRYLATGGLDRTIHLWDTRTREHLQAFPGHRGAISSLVFRQGTQQLMSGSFDRTIKLWSVEDRSYIDTLYGHQSEVLSIDCLRQERVLSAGRDRTLRLWKIPDETQLVFRGHAASMECCCFITNAEFLSGSDDGCVALWSTMRKKPAYIAKSAHVASAHDSTAVSKDVSVERLKQVTDGEPYGNGNMEVGSISSKSATDSGGAAVAWVGAVAVCRGSDLAASGAGDGFVRLWALEEGNRSLRALHGLPVKGFVNSLAFARSGRFLLAGVGQEPRLGRWGRSPHARNGVVLHNIDLM